MDCLQLERSLITGGVYIWEMCVMLTDASKDYIYGILENYKQ